MNAADRFLTALTELGLKYKQTGQNKYLAQCPAHDDTNPSLAVARSRGQVLLHCFAGCAYVEILQAVGMSEADGFDNRKQVDYAYYSNGEHIGTVHRAPGKKIWKSPPGGGLLKPLYNPSQVTNFDGFDVYVTEGEKDADTFTAFAPEGSKTVAVSAAGGASNWDKADYSPLQNARHVYIVTDMDQPGHRRAAGLRERMKDQYGFARERLECVRPKPGCHDLTDHLMAGHTVEALDVYDVHPEDLPDTAQAEYAAPGRTLTITRADQVSMKKQRFLDAEKVLPIGTLTSFIGRGGEGKTAYAFDLVAQLSRGTLPGESFGEPRDVLIIAPEDDKATQIVPRLTAADADLAKVHMIEIRNDDGKGYAYLESPNLDDDLQRIDEAVQHTEAALIVFDPITASMNADTNKARDVRAELMKVNELAKQRSIAVICIQHVRKGTGGALADRASGSHAFRDVVRSSLQFATDRETGERIATIDKDNYSGLQGTSWAFTIEPVTVTDRNGTKADTIKVRHLGRSDITVDELLRRDDAEPDSKSESAKDWLTEYIGERMVPRADVIKAGKLAGHAEATLKRAAKSVCESTRTGFGEGSLWQLKRNTG